MTVRDTRLSAQTERVLLWCGVVAPVLFVATFLVAGAIPMGYDPLQHPVSSLVLSEIGWVQVANFLIAGALFLAFSWGFGPAWRRHHGGTWEPRLIALVGVGLIGSGLFPTDPISGYPPGTPIVVERTMVGAVHSLFGIPVFLGLLAACIVVARRFAKTGRTAWAIYAGVVAVAFLAGFVLFNLGFSQVPGLMPLGGLLQRLTLIVGLSCVATIAWYLLRHLDEPSRG